MRQGLIPAESRSWPVARRRELQARQATGVDSRIVWARTLRAGRDQMAPVARIVQRNRRHPVRYRGDGWVTLARAPPSRFATRFLKFRTESVGLSWRALRDSNSRPTDSKSVALST